MTQRLIPKSRIATFFAYAYLLRVQILIFVAMWALPGLAIGRWSAPRSLLENLFITSPFGLFLSTLSALLVGWSLLLTTRVVLLNGYERFGIKQWWTENTLKLKVLVTASVIAAPMIGVQLFAWRGLHRSTEPVPTLKLTEAVAAGAIVAYLVAYIGVLFALTLAPAGTQRAAETFPAWWFFRALLKKADSTGLPDRITAPIKRVVARLSPDWYAGYIDKRRRFKTGLNSGYQLPWSGHFVAVTFAVLTFVVYYLIGGYRTAHVNAPTSIPGLTFILLLLLISNWVGTALTFFFDRFRIPLLIPAFVLALLTSQCSADHVFETVADGSAASIKPWTVVSAHARRSPGGPIVIVATAGGGIQAAAWTAKVLTGLEHESLGWKTPLAPRIALISAVSGGAVGSMFFLNEYKIHPEKEKSGFEADGALNAIVERAEAPALDDVVWSLVYNDVPRLFTARRSSDPLLDRGRELELSWRRQADLKANLSDWRAGVAEGLRPGVIFNATIAETGEPLLLSTTDLTDQTGKDKNGKQVLAVRKSFRERYPHLDVPVVTAVRLASSFPYVSPAARADRGTNNDHLIDGGYYDNFGVASAVDWIDEAVRHSTDGTFPPVLFILIKSFPNAPIPDAKARGWFFQLYAPLKGLFNVRTATQLVRDRFEMLQLRDRLDAGRKTKPNEPNVRFATFQFPEDSAPLSWTMNARQIDAIEDQWEKVRKSAEAEKKGDNIGDDLVQVKCALLGRTASSRCDALASKDPW